jgi:peptidoglycan/xylan/chitin deacetylase (PgdA/CDA1 family)
LLQYLLDKHGIISPQETEERLLGKARPLNYGRIPYLVTLDDGFKNHATLALPILEKFQVKAVFFICPGLMDLQPEKQREAIIRYVFDGNFKKAEATDGLTLMSWSDAESVAGAGHTLGSHTLCHRRLSHLRQPDLEQEIFLAADLIEKKLKIPVKWFAPPFGDLKSIDSRSFKAIGRQFQFSCTAIRGLNSSATRPLELLREGIDLRNSFYYQKMVLAGGLDFLCRAKGLELAKMAAAP